MLPDLTSGTRLALAAEYPILSASLGYVNPNTPRYATYAADQFNLQKESIWSLIYASETNPGMGLQELLQNPGKSGIDPSLHTIAATTTPNGKIKSHAPGGILSDINKFMPVVGTGLMALPMMGQAFSWAFGAAAIAA